MRVIIPNEAKKWLTVAEMPKVRKIIAELKEDTSTAADYAEQAAEAIMYTKTGHFFSSRAEILKATAKIARNNRILNYYSENSDRLDVWIDFIVFDEYDGAMSGGAYLSDIWSITADDNSDIVKNMYYQIYIPIYDRPRADDGRPKARKDGT